MSIYDPVDDIIASVTLFLEASSTGSVSLYHTILTSKLHSFAILKENVHIHICQIIFVAMLIIYSIYTISYGCSSGCKDVWLWFNVSVVIFSWLTVGIFIKCTLLTVVLLTRVQIVKSEYINTYQTLLWHKILIIVLSVLISVMTIAHIRLLTLSKRLCYFMYVLVEAFRSLLFVLCFIFITTAVMVGLMMTFWFYYGSSNSFLLSDFVTSLLMKPHERDVEPTREVNAIIYMSFIIILFVWLLMIKTILLTTYTDTKYSIRYQKQVKYITFFKEHVTSLLAGMTCCKKKREKKTVIINTEKVDEDKALKSTKSEYLSVISSDHLIEFRDIDSFISLEMKENVSNYKMYEDAISDFIFLDAVSDDAYDDVKNYSSKFFDAASFNKTSDVDSEERFQDISSESDIGISDNGARNSYLSFNNDHYSFTHSGAERNELQNKAPEFYEKSFTDFDKLQLSQEAGRSEIINPDKNEHDYSTVQNQSDVLKPVEMFTVQDATDALDDSSMIDLIEMTDMWKLRQAEIKDPLVPAGKQQNYTIEDMEHAYSEEEERAKRTLIIDWIESIPHGTLFEEHSTDNDFLLKPVDDFEFETIESVSQRNILSERKDENILLDPTVTTSLNSSYQSFHRADLSHNSEGNIYPLEELISVDTSKGRIRDHESLKSAENKLSILNDEASLSVKSTADRRRNLYFPTRDKDNSGASDFDVDAHIDDRRGTLYYPVKTLEEESSFQKDSSTEFSHEQVIENTSLSDKRRGTLYYPVNRKNEYTTLEDSHDTPVSEGEKMLRGNRGTAYYPVKMKEGDMSVENITADTFSQHKAAKYDKIPPDGRRGTLYYPVKNRHDDKQAAEEPGVISQQTVPHDETLHTEKRATHDYLMSGKHKEDKDLRGQRRGTLYYAPQDQHALRNNENTVTSQYAGNNDTSHVSKQDTRLNYINKSRPDETLQHIPDEFENSSQMLFSGKLYSRDILVHDARSDSIIKDKESTVESVFHDPDSIFATELIDSSDYAKLETQYKKLTRNISEPSFDFISHSNESLHSATSAWSSVAAAKNDRSVSFNRKPSHQKGTHRVQIKPDLYQSIHSTASMYSTVSSDFKPLYEFRDVNSKQTGVGARSKTRASHITTAKELGVGHDKHTNSAAVFVDIDEFQDTYIEKSKNKNVEEESFISLDTFASI